MRNLRRVIASLSMVAILSMLVVSTASAASFTDVKEGTYYYSAVEELATAGVISKASTLYNPQANMERGLAAGYVVLAVPFTLENPTVASFPDVPLTHPYFRYVETAKTHSIISGYTNGNFGPNDTLTREQYAKMTVEAFGIPTYVPETPTFSDVRPGMPLYEYVETAYHYQVLNGYNGKFNPTAAINRADAAVITKQAMNATPRPEAEEEDNGELEGAAGSVEEYELIASYSSEEVGEGEEDSLVYGMNITADDGSDLNFTAFTIDFDHDTGTGTGGSDTAWQDFVKYAEDVTVWYGDEELARVDADEFDDDNAYRKTVSFGENAIVRAGETGKFYVGITGISNLDSQEATDEWEIDVDNVRFEDAQEAVISEDPTLNNVEFSFQTLATAASVDVTASFVGPQEGTIEGDDSSDTNNVLLLEGKLKLSGDEEVVIKTLPITFVSTSTNVDDLANAFILKFDGDEVDTKQPTDGTADNYDSTVVEVLDCDDVACTITFNELSYETSEDVAFEVLADFENVDATTVQNGDSLQAKLTSTGFQAADVELNGEDLANSDLKGSALGKAQYLYATGFSFNLISAEGETQTAADSNADDAGSFTIEFELTAFGGDVTIDRSCEEGGANAPDQGVEYIIMSPTDGANNATTCSMTSTADDNTSDSGAAWLLSEGDTETFTLTVAANTITASQFAKVYLESINWDDTVTDTDPDLYFTSGLGESTTSTNTIYIINNV